MMRVLSYLQTGLHSVAKPWHFIEQHPMLLLVALLLVIGSGGTWIVMPLSGEYRLSDFQSAAQSGQFKLVVLGLTGLIFLTTAMRMYVVRLLICYSLTMLLLSIALSISMLDGERIQLFISESQAFRDIQHILALNTIPNAGRSVETALAFDAYHFSDRIRVTLGILGWGAKLSILMALGISIYFMLSARRQLIAVLLALIFALGTFFITGVSSVSLAYLKVNQGVRAINNGEHAVAMRALNDAAQLDPVLTYSPGFTLLHSYLHFSTFGPESPLAKSYQLEQRFTAGRFNEVIELNSLSPSAAIVQEGMAEELALQGFVSAHIRTEQQITMDALNRLGLLHLWRREWGIAEKYFKASLAISVNPVSQTALLRIYEQTRQYEACVSTADTMLQNTKNRSVSADVWSSKGDCLSELRRPTEARYAYQQSIALDSDKNYRAVKGLSGT